MVKAEIFPLESGLTALCYWSGVAAIWCLSWLKDSPPGKKWCSLPDLAVSSSGLI